MNKKITITCLAAGLILGFSLNSCGTTGAATQEQEYLDASKIEITKDEAILNAYTDKTSARYKDTVVIFTTLEKGKEPTFSFTGASGVALDVTFIDNRKEVIEEETTTSYKHFFVMPELESKEEVLKIKVSTK